MTKHSWLLGSATCLFLFGCGGSDQAAPAASPQSAAPPVTTVAAAPTMPPTASTESAPPAPAAPKPPMAELQKKTIMAMLAGFNAHDAKKVMEVTTPDATFAYPGPAGMTEDGRDVFEKRQGTLFAAEPDLKIAATRSLSKGDMAVTEWVSTGTNTGPTMDGGKPTGKKTGVHGIWVQFFDGDGLVKKQLGYLDRATVLQQMGLLPGKPRAAADLPTGETQWVRANDDDAEAKLADWAKTANWPSTWTKHDRKAYEATLADDSSHIDYSFPQDFIGKKAMLAEYDLYLKAFPDEAVTIDNVWVVGNQVVTQFTYTGTMKGALGPMKAANKPITVHGIDVDEAKDGKLGKSFTYANGMEILSQMGMLPKPKGEKKEEKKEEKKPADKK